MKLIKNNFILFSILFLSFLGFLDAAYLAILHFKNAFPPCTITSGCETVLTSKYATIYGIPIALLGVFYYLAVLILTLLIVTYPKKTFEKNLFLISLSGTVVSLVLIYIQFAILKTYCQYCLISEVISFLIFGLAFLFLRLQSNKGR